MIQATRHKLAVRAGFGQAVEQRIAERLGKAVVAFGGVEYVGGRSMSQSDPQPASALGLRARRALADGGRGSSGGSGKGQEATPTESAELGHACLPEL